LVALALSLGAASRLRAQDLERGPDRAPNTGQGLGVGHGVPCVQCQIVSVTPAEAEALPGTLAGLSLAVRLAPDADVPRGPLAAIARRGARAALHVTGVPDDRSPLLDADVAALILEPAAGDPDQLAFALKRTLAAARGRRPGMRLLVSADADVAGVLRARGVTPYADGFVPPSSPLEDAAALLQPIDVERGDTLVRRLPADVPRASAIVAAAGAATAWFPRGLVPVPDRPLRCGDDRSMPAYLNPQTLDLVATSASCPAPAVVIGDVAGVVAERLDVDGIAAFRLPAGAGDRFAEDVTVGGARTLTADEVVARHQAFAARQDASVATDIATGTLTLTFEAPTFVAPVTVTAATTIYRDRERVDLRESEIRVNGVAFSPADGVPRLPILEPERVAALPLTITLTNVYRYSLEGRDTIDGRPCYVIGFTPRLGQDHVGQAAPVGSLFDGRAWIDTETFAMARVSAVQTGLKGPILASEQIDTYAPDAAGRWLLARSDIRQTYEGPGIRTPIHRLLLLDRHDVNAADFASRRAAAYASPDVMLRDTPDGFRYLKRGKPAAGSREPEAGSREPEAGGRTLAEPVTHIRTIAAGVIVDPNISTPLPFAGLSYVDFDLWHTGTQFSGFFGGSYAQVAFSVPSLRGSRWQMAGRAFAIATSYNDRAFVDGAEIYSRDIRQRPAQASVWLLRPLAARAAVRLEYDWDYNRFGRTDVTDPAFVIPRNQNAHGLRAGVDWQVAGWQASIWASHTIRLGWERWGVPGSDEDAAPRRAFDRAGASVLRTAALSPRVTARAEGAFVTGRDLDRFSRVSFGTFDNRLHGYPSALIRYDRGAVLRTALSWAAAKAIRLDGFADAAAVHDPAFGPGLRPYTGFGAAVECPAPFGTLLAAEWGYGVQGVNTNGRTGTQVVRITAYKVF
jgi:hypothetical protein